MHKIIKSLVVILSLAVFLVSGGLAQTKAPGKLVNFKQLLPFVNLKLADWKLEGSPKGNTIKSSHVNMSQVEANYKSGDKSLELTIVDSSLAAMAAMGMGFMGKMEVESTEESTRSVKVQGYQAIETYKHKEKKGQLVIVVGNRLVITLEGEGIENSQVLQDFAQHLELNKLADLTQ